MSISRFEFVLFASLAASSLSTKAMGLAWLTLVLAGLWVWVKTRGQLRQHSDPFLFRAWLIVTTLALTTKAIPMIYWEDPWSERHGELRLFLGALALYALTQSVSLSRTSLALIAHALSISSVLGLIWVVMHGRDQLPTHPIPWAGSLAMISALLLALSLKSDLGGLHRRIWLLCGLLAVMAVLSSQSRGAFGIVLWWLVVCSHHLWIHRKTAATLIIGVTQQSTARLTMMGLALLTGLALIGQSPILERPVESLYKASQEIATSQLSVEKGANSSVGARLYLWQQSWQAIQESPWIGVGHDGRKLKLAQWADMSDSDMIKNLGHVHNEYLNQLLDHGLPGLLSQLFYILGLAWLAWKLHQRHAFAASTAIAGICFVHMTTSLSNVNFAHNLYTSALSLLICISLWMSTLRER